MVGAPARTAPASTEFTSSGHELRSWLLPLKSHPCTRGERGLVFGKKQTAGQKALNHRPGSTPRAIGLHQIKHASTATTHRSGCYCRRRDAVGCQDVLAFAMMALLTSLKFRTEYTHARKRLYPHVRMKHGGLRPLLVLDEIVRVPPMGVVLCPTPINAGFSEAASHASFSRLPSYAERSAVLYCFELRALRVKMSQVDCLPPLSA